MAFSFSNWFKTKPGDEQASSDEAAPTATAQETPPPEATAPTPQPAVTAPAPAQAPPQQRPVASLKSVVPNSVRPAGLHETTPRQTTLMPLPSASSPLRMPGSGPTSSSALSPQARTIAFPGGGGGSGMPQPILTTPAAATSSAGFASPTNRAPATPEPAPAQVAPDVTINLTLGDFVDKIPANLLKGGSIDRQRVVPFKAGDLYSDLSRGRATVPASAIYALCPDLFAKPVSDTEDVEVALPLQKLVEQLSTNLQPRADQVAEENVGEIETPFLQVALEDNARFPKAASKPAAAPAAPAVAPGPSRTPTPPVSQAPPPAAASAPTAPTPPVPATPTIPVPAMPAPVSAVAPVTPRPVSPVAAIPARAPAPATPTIKPVAPAPLLDLGGLSPTAALRAVQISAVRPTPPSPIEPTPASAPATPAPAAAPIGVVKRPPSTVRASVAGGKIRLSGPALPARSINLVPLATGSGNAPASVAPGMPPLVVKPAPVVAAPNTAGAPSAHSVLKRTARIQIPPISVRTGAPAPASLRPTAPASQSSVRAQPMPPAPMPNFRSSPGGGSGSPGAVAPPSSSARPMPAAPPPPSGFKPFAPLPSIAPSGVTARLAVPPPPVLFAPPAPAPAPKPEPESLLPAPAPAPAFAPPVEAAAPDAAPESPALPAVAAIGEETIHLALAPILRALPSTFLSSASAAATIADDVRVALPLAQITPQLAQGRVNIRRAVFEAGLPEAHRGILAPGDDPAEIPLPLQEIFQNLPTGALAHRHDQVLEELGPLIPTPFSQKAEEDAVAIRAAAALEVATPSENEATLTAEAPAPEVSVTEPTRSVLEAAAPISVVPAIEPAAVAETTRVESAAVPVQIETESFFGSAAPDVESALMEAETAAAVEETVPAPAASVSETAPTASVAESATSVMLTDPSMDDEPAVPSFLIEEPFVAPAAGRAEAEKAAMAAVPAVVAETGAPAVIEVPTESVVAAAEPAPVVPLTTEISFAPVVAAATPALPEHAAASEERAMVAATIEPAVGTKSAAAQPEPEAATTATSALAVAGSADSRQERVEAAQEALREVFMLDEDFDAKKVVKLASQLPGMKACTIMFTDGLKLAGNFSADQEGEGFCAMTPAFFQKARTFTRELSLGELSDFTIHTERGLLLSFFMHEDVCVSVAHSGRGFLPGVREKLQNITRQVAAMYSTKQ